MRSNRVIKRIHSYGIAIHGFFIFGFDEEDEDVFARTVSFARKARLETAQFDYLTPYPGTAFGESLDRAGRIVTKDWARYGFELVFEPRSMTREMLQNGHDWVWSEFYSLPSIWRRLRIRHPHPWVFWIANLAFRAQRRKERQANSKKFREVLGKRR